MILANIMHSPYKLIVTLRYTVFAYGYGRVNMSAR